MLTLWENLLFCKRKLDIRNAHTAFLLCGQYCRSDEMKFMYSDNLMLVSLTVIYRKVSHLEIEVKQLDHEKGRAQHQGITAASG